MDWDLNLRLFETKLLQNTMVFEWPSTALILKYWSLVDLFLVEYSHRNSHYISFGYTISIWTAYKWSANWTKQLSRNYPYSYWKYEGKHVCIWKHLEGRNALLKHSIEDQIYFETIPKKMHHHRWTDFPDIARRLFFINLKQHFQRLLASICSLITIYYYLEWTF